MKEYNRSMSAVKINVEWLFRQIATFFKFIDFRKNLCLGLSPVGKFYIIAALLENALTCCYGSIVSETFGLMLPSLEEYFVNYG